MYKGTLFIITATSGTGKTSLVKSLLESMHNLTVSISHTTRQPRKGEEDSIHYHFVNQDTFAQMVNAGQFLEYAEVFGNYYGTSEQAVKQALDNGIDVILEIDWQGALQVKKIFNEAVMIFILPPDKYTLRQRLAGRGQDSQEVINKRLAGSIDEMRQYLQFDYIVINDHFETALTDIKSIITAHRLTLAKQQVRHRDKIMALLA